MGHAGWIGPLASLRYYLATVGADRDADGSYRTTGSITVGLGGGEAVVGADVSYYVDGEPKNLAAGLRGTSMGLGVSVY